MKKIILTFHFFYLFLSFSFAQIEIPFFGDKSDKKDYEEFVKNDTESRIDSVVLPTIHFVKPIKFNNSTDRNYYNWLWKKVLKVYPMHQKAVVEYKSLHDSIQKFGKNKDVKILIKKRQNELAQQYENQLRDLTRTEGIIFSKLMHRSTKRTTYEIIKELKGGFNAFLWNIKSSFVDIDLKEPFNPEEIHQDYFIENIIIRAKMYGYIR